MDMTPLAFDSDGSDLIDHALQTVRTHFDMPVAYLSQFDGDRLVFRNVSAPGLEDLVKPGDSMLLTDTYCRHVQSGALPNLIPDTAQEPICQTLPITQSVPIGSHISLPIDQADGTIFGMFCCLSPVPNPNLNERDLQVMATFAGLVTRQVQFEEDARRATLEQQTWGLDLLERQAFSPVFQPLVQLDSRKLVGVEALTRFDDSRGTETVFLHMAEAGLGLDLELATMARAFDAATGIARHIYLSVNASPSLICDTRFRNALASAPASQTVVEITEHSLPEDEIVLRRHIDALRGDGVRIAIDDVGAGYSGLQRLAQVSPDILKLDRALVSGVDNSRTQRAVVAALVNFAAETRAQVLVEGVETEEEAACLRALGVEMAQGWLFGKPAPFEHLQMC